MDENITNVDNFFNQKFEKKLQFFLNDWKKHMVGLDWP